MHVSCRVVGRRAGSGHRHRCGGSQAGGGAVRHCRPPPNSTLRSTAMPSWSPAAPRPVWSACDRCSKPVGPLLVEKPFAPTLAEVDELLRAGRGAAAPGDVRVRRAVQRCVAYRRSRRLDGPPLHLLAVRHSPPAPRIASSVVTDLMLHDLDVAQRLFGPSRPHAGRCRVRASADTRTWCEIADATIAFGGRRGGAVATLSANRMGQRKVRSLSRSTPAASWSRSICCVRT
jgi:hypothetical protein